MFCSRRWDGAAPISSMPRCLLWSRRHCTPSHCRARAPTSRCRPTDRCTRRASCCRRPVGLSYWWRWRSWLTPSCRRACPRICSRSSAAPASMRRRWWRLARCSGAARICELMFARSIHPLAIARFAVAVLLAAFALIALVGLTAAAAASFAVLFGMANGLLTIARGAVPLALFGAAGYGHLVGRIGGPYLVMQAIAPLALAFVAERSCDAAVLAVAAAFATIAFIAFAAVRRPKDIAR